MTLIGLCSYIRFVLFEFLCIVMWRIWFKRNRKVHDNSVIHEEDVVNWAAAFLNDFWRVNEQTGGCVGEMVVRFQDGSPQTKEVIS